MTSPWKRRPTRPLTLLVSALAAGALALTITPAAATTTAPGNSGQLAHPMPWDSNADTDGYHESG
jgi:hypothetical protein